MNLFNQFQIKVLSIVEDLSAQGALPPALETAGLTVEPPRDPAHGDLATNAALVLARSARMKPRAIADAIAARLAEDEAVTAAEVAGPGFINLRLADSFWHARLAEVLVAGKDYGASDIGRGRKVNVEYVSANPTGPLHIGHARGAVFGDALSSLLQKVGYDVTREYYVNDAGAQVEALERSVYFRYREALGQDVGEIPEGSYPGDYLVPVGQALAKRDGDKWLSAATEDWTEECANFARNAMMDLIKNDLATLGVGFDRFESERDLHLANKIDEAIKLLKAKNLIHTGVPEPPKGKVPDDWEPREQLLFRSTAFGDDADRPLTRRADFPVKSTSKFKNQNEMWTYFASDIAYHLDKIERGAAVLINVWGADHAGYVKRMKAAVTALTDGEAELDVKLCQLVKLSRRGKPVKMSKRAGRFVTLREVVDEVGKDVVRFIMLTRKNDAPLDFDLQRVTEQSRDNPVFYVQYAHARACSVMRHVAEDLPGLDLEPEALAGADMGRLTDAAELALIKLLAGWPRQVESAAEAHEPHRLAFYLHDLAGAFHGLWNKGKEEPRLRFIVADSEALTRARLALVRSVALVIAAGLEIFGVEPVEEMR